MKRQLLTLLYAVTAILPAKLTAQNIKLSHVYMDKQTNNPRFAEIAASVGPTEEVLFSWLRKTYSIEANLTFKLLSEEADELGFLHKKYVQYANGKEIFSSMLIVHLRNGLVESFNGEYYKSASPQSFELNKTKAFEKAWQSYGNLPIEACNEMLEHPDFLKTEAFASQKYCPVRKTESLTSVEPCYFLNVFNLQPYVYEQVLLHAVSGQILGTYPVEIHADSNGRANTHYIGQQNLKADYIAKDSFRLRETGTRKISTSKLSLGTDFFDKDNYWDNGSDKIAGDIHVGAELVHDFLKSYFNRNSFDNKGATLNSITSSGSGNAFWNLSANTATFLVGTGGGLGPCAAIDVVGHEYGHGICEESGGLLYSGEACALHESFADITGHMIEHFRDSATANWRIGEAVWASQGGIRDMKNPHQFNDPKAYGGQFFPKGCHGSGGVQNRWFYLMVKGDTGVNEFSYAFSLYGLGHNKAAQITYRSIFYYLIPNSTFKDALYGSIKAAKDLYGSCSPELEYTHKAWKAVNVDDPSVITVDLSHGIGAPSQMCQGAPVQVTLNSFGDKSRKVKWLIDNKDTSTAWSWKPTFSKTGFFPIVLETNTCGKLFYDSMVIAINYLPEPKFLKPFDTACVSTDTARFINQTVNKDATLPLKYEWYVTPSDLYSTSKDLAVTFLLNLTYEINLKAYYQGGCWSNLKKEVLIQETAKPDFSVLRNSCQGRAIKVANLTDTVNKGFTFTWYFADATTHVGFLPNNKGSSISGYQPIILEAKSKNQGCKDTVMRWIEIYKNPIVDFTYENACRNQLVKLITKGTFFYDKDWSSWDVSYAKPINKDTFFAQVGDSATRTIGLTLSDKRGCSSTGYKTFQTKELSIDLSVSNVCLGDSSRMIYSVKASNPYTLMWDFGDGTTYNKDLNAHSYSMPGTYQMALVAKNADCNSARSVDAIVYERPKAGFKSQDICFGDTARFENLTPGKATSDFLWFFADGNSSTTADPKHFYASNQTKTYVVSLKAINAEGCRDSITKPFTVNELPVCDFSFDRDPLVSDNGFKFTAQSAGQKTYQWYFGDGDSSNQANPTHQYKTNNTFQVDLRIISVADCECHTSKLVQATYTGVESQNSLIHRVYPNPFNEILNVYLNEKAAYKLFSIDGKLVSEGLLNQGANVIFTADIVKGSYLLKIRNGTVLLVK